jgi:subtilisin family serine protease
MTYDGYVTRFSNLSKTTTFAAPGYQITSAGVGTTMRSASGTSMASPNATGVAAMVLGYHPELSAVELKNLLMKSSTKVAAFSDKTVSGGRVNLKTALSKAKR